MSVMFIRLKATNATEITRMLANLYADGWRVVSHTDDAGEYSFVLEREQP